MAKFESKGDKLYINGKLVLKGWESFSGWYWFATEKLEDDYNGKPLWFGFVQGLEQELIDRKEELRQELDSVCEQLRKHRIKNPIQ